MLVWLQILRRLGMRLLTECQLDKAKTACQPIISLYLHPETLILTISANSLGHKLAQSRVHKVGDDPDDLLGPLLYPGGHVHLDHGLDNDALGFVFFGDRLRPEETTLFGTEPVKLEVAFRRYVAGFVERLEGVDGRGRARTVIVGYQRVRQWGKNQREGLARVKGQANDALDSPPGAGKNGHKLVLS